MPGIIRAWVQGFADKALTRGVAYTSLDAMKLLAIVSMTVDHIGFYFYPQEPWWRSLGRVTIPVWFFLVGYSRTHQLGSAIWIYALLLIADRIVMGSPYPLMPLNVLITVIACRYFLNFCIARNWLPSRIPTLILFCVVVTVFTFPFFEYGSIAFLFALLGHMIREKEKKHFTPLVWASYITYIFWQLAWFGFDAWQGECAAFGSLAVVLWLADFHNDVIWPDWRHSRFKTFFAVLSRNTMPYYFYHRLIFEVIAAVTQHRGFFMLL